MARSRIGNDIVMHLQLSFISNLDFKPLFVPIEANLGSVHLYTLVVFLRSFART